MQTSWGCGQISEPVLLSKVIPLPCKVSRPHFVKCTRHEVYTLQSGQLETTSTDQWLVYVGGYFHGVGYFSQDTCIFFSYFWIHSAPHKSEVDFTLIPFTLEWYNLHGSRSVPTTVSTGHLIPSKSLYPITLMKLHTRWLCKTVGILQPQELIPRFIL